MKRLLTLLCLVSILFSVSAMADEATWSFKWDKSKSNGGEGFYHISSNDETTQTAVLNGLQWTYDANTSVTAYTGTAGQYFGSAKSPVTHATLSTENLKGKIKSVTVEAKKKDGAEVTVGVSVNGVAYSYNSSLTASLTTEWASHQFVTTDDGQEGIIVISMDQTATPGPIYFLGLSIVYDGEGVVEPVVEKVLPGLKYEQQEMTVEAGDNAYANYLTNPYKVSPIKYNAADETIAVIGDNGNIFTTGKVGTTTVTASFAGNDSYLPETASYTLNVVAKPVIPVPAVDVPAGIYTEAQTVTITSNDPLCKAIWYSTVARDSVELTDEPVIVAGNTATVTLDADCTLLCCAVGDNNIGCVLSQTYSFNIPLQAAFGAEESKTVYYSMGWDSVEEASTWKYYGINENYSWTLTETPTLSGTQSFSSIDPESKYSMSIQYSYSSSQRERAVSPEIAVRENSQVEFYACFNGIWLVYADWKLNVKDITAGTSDMLVSGFNWAQENAFTGPNWVRFAYDLKKYAGHTCQFEFIYEGQGGDDMSIDGFKLTQEDMSPDAKITIMQGDCVHFRDMSAGHPDSWAWTFEGAESESSSEQNPVVTYNVAGEYKVSLTVGKGDLTSTVEKAGYIIVNVEAPKACIGLPETAYLSPWAAAYVPLNVPVTFLDESKGSPSSWNWNFTGTDIQNSTEQNPTVTYTAEGKYGLDLTVSNAAGTDKDFLVDAIQAGGALDVWNITPEESADVAEVSLGWYGSYAGTNWVGMKSFAEHFHKPAVAATIDNVTVYFAKTQADDQDAEITVGICPADMNGMPGDAIATSSLKVSELQYDANEVVPTVFHLTEAVTVDTDFFITITGFPDGYSDNVSVLCAYRGPGKKNTAYHLLEDEDDNYNLLGTYTWYANEDDALSLAMTAHMKYNDVTTGVAGVTAKAYGAANGIYDMNGVRMSAGHRMMPGIYVVRDGEQVRKIMVK